MAAENKAFEFNENGHLGGAQPNPEEEMPRIEVIDPQEVIPMTPHQIEPSNDEYRKKRSKASKFIERQCYILQSIYVKLLTTIIFLIIGWTLLYLIFHNEMNPSGMLFRLLVLIILSYIVGIGFTYIRLPALLGMLFTGVVLKTVGFFYLTGVYQDIVLISRNVALSVILTKAGLGLDSKAMKKLKFTVLKLAILPCCAETVAAALFTHFLLGYPWLWAFLLGFLLSPVSPAVVVPSLLNLKEQGYGEDKGISTLVIAASSIDDIVAISGFGVVLSSIFAQSENLVMDIVHGPLEVIIGLLAGIAWGLVAACFPLKTDPNVVSKRTAMVGIGGLCAVMGSGKIGFPGAGPLACITSAFVAALAWKIQGWDDDKPSPVSNVFSGFWTVMQPILFSLIGTEIDLYSLIPENVAYGVAVVLFSLMVRIIACFLSLIGDTLNFKEIIFVNLSWLPKATVQAALSPQALDILRSEKNPPLEELERAKMLLTTAVLAIILTAPIGAIAISLTGPKLLSKKPQLPNEPDQEIQR